MKLHEYVQTYQVFEHNKKVGLRNIKTGKEVIPPENKSIHTICPYYADQIVLLKVNNGKKYYLYNTDGLKLTEGMDYIGDYNYGIARFMKGKTWGFFDYEGKIFIPPKYDKAEKIDLGKYKVKLNGKCGVVDETGEIVKLEYDDIFFISGKLYGKNSNSTYIRLLV